MNSRNHNKKPFLFDTFIQNMNNLCSLYTAGGKCIINFHDENKLEIHLIDQLVIDTRIERIGETCKEKFK